jgi:hypothetical protein
MDGEESAPNLRAINGFAVTATPWPGRLSALAALLGGLALLNASPASARLTTGFVQELEEALNSGDESAIAILVQGSDGLIRSDLESRYAQLRERFPDSRWSLSLGPDQADGRSTLEVKVEGSSSRDGRSFRLNASQTLAVNSDGTTLGDQEVLSEESVVHSGERDLPVSLMVPDTVLTGQRYDFDVLMDEPLSDAVLAGGLAELTPEQLSSGEGPDLKLGALNAGGIFKTIQAPYRPGSQSWAVLLLHPQGTVSISRMVRVVNRL